MLRTFLFAATVGTIIAVAVLAARTLPMGTASAATAVDVAVDMDVTGNDARLTGFVDTATDIQNCGEIDSADTNTIDIDVILPPPGVNAADGIQGYQFTLGYDPAVVTISAEDKNMLLAAAAGSALLPLSDPLPDSDGTFLSGAAELGFPPGIEPAGTYEVGPGVLTRITLTGVAPGTTPLTLTDVIPVDAASGPIPVDTITTGTVSVDLPCAIAAQPDLRITAVVCEELPEVVVIENAGGAPQFLGGTDGDGDTLIDEDPWDGPTLVAIADDFDDDGDSVDDDGDTLVNEDWPDGDDNDGDTLIDEDPLDSVDEDGGWELHGPAKGQVLDLGIVIGGSPGAMATFPAIDDDGDAIDDDGDNAVLETDGIDNDGDTDVDEPGEGINEDPVDGIDNDGDTSIDEDPIDGVNEDPVDGVDNDGDTSIDEDPPESVEIYSGTGATAAADADPNDNKYLWDEEAKFPDGDPTQSATLLNDGVAFDDDGDTLINEDPEERHNFVATYDNDGDGDDDEDGPGSTVVSTLNCTEIPDPPPVIATPTPTPTPVPTEVKKRLGGSPTAALGESTGASSLPPTGDSIPVHDGGGSVLPWLFVGLGAAIAVTAAGYVVYGRTRGRLSR